MKKSGGRFSNEAGRDSSGIERRRAGWMVVFRSSPARSAGVSRAAIHAGIDGLAALVLLHSGARRAARIGSQDRGGYAAGIAGRDVEVRRVERNGRASASAAGRCEKNRDAVF